MNTWNVFNARISLFVRVDGLSTKVDVATLYQSIWGPPDSYIGSTIPNQQSVARGTRGQVQIACAVSPTRIDFILSPSPPEQSAFEAETSLPLINDSRQINSELLHIFESIENGAPPKTFSGSALVLQFMCGNRSSFSDANKALVERIPTQYRISLNDEEDFTFQVNRPQKSEKNSDSKFNFITKWSVDRVSVLKFQVAMPNNVIGMGANMNQSTVEMICPSIVCEANNAPFNSPSPFTGKDISEQLRERFNQIKSTQIDIGLNIDGF